MISKRMWAGLFGIICLALLVSFSAPQPALAQAKVGVVDLNSALKGCKQGKKALVELQRKAKKFDNELKSMQKEVARLRKDLENTAMLLKPEARMSKERDFERTMRKLRERQRDAKQELMESERASFNPILRRMTGIIKKIGAQGKYGLIVEVKSAFYYPPSADITKQVIAAYDKTHP